MIAAVLLPKKALNRPHTVGALPDPNTRTRKMKNRPATDATVNACSLGCNGTW